MNTVFIDFGSTSGVWIPHKKRKPKWVIFKDASIWEALAVYRQYGVKRIVIESPFIRIGKLTGVIKSISNWCVWTLTAASTGIEVQAVSPKTWQSYIRTVFGVDFGDKDGYLTEARRLSGDQSIPKHACDAYLMWAWWESAR